MNPIKLTEISSEASIRAAKGIVCILQAYLIFFSRLQRVIPFTKFFLFSFTLKDFFCLSFIFLNLIEQIL